MPTIPLTDNLRIIQAPPLFGVNYAKGFDAFTVRRKDFIAAGISWFERWDSLPNLPVPSHAFKIVDEEVTVEAFADGVHYGKLSAYLDDPDVAVLVRRQTLYTPVAGDTMVSKSIEYVGQRYNYVLIGAMAIVNSFAGHAVDRLTGDWLGHKLEDLADSKRRAICSEVVAASDQALPWLNGLGCLSHKPWEISPELLFTDRFIYDPGVIELVRQLEY